MRKKDINHLVDKEKEILDTYSDDIEEYEEVEEYQFSEEKEEKPKEHKKKNFLLLNIIFVVLILLIAMIATDIIAVKKFNSGPFFVIPLKTHNDGGTKEYYGLGYKVIKYNQTRGRKDTVIGTWGLKYNTDVVEIDVIDLAIEFTDKPGDSFKKYDGKYIEVNGVLTNVGLNDNIITVSYVDDGGKYNFDVVCDMASSKEELNNLEMNIRITAKGTVYDFEYKTPDQNPRLHLKDCFAKQDL